MKIVRFGVLGAISLGLFGFVSLDSGQVAEAGPVISTLNCDVDGDAARDAADAVYILTWLFLAGPPPVELRLEGAPTQILNGDCNGDNSRDIADCVHLLFFLFVGGPEPVGPGPEPTTYAGALNASRGRWSYAGTVGLEGAMILCNERFPGSTVCTGEQLLAAAAAGELVDAVDINGTPVASFWIHDPSTDPNRQCIHSGLENVNWTYATGHLPSHGEYVLLDRSTGSLSELLLQNHCAGSHWVACCNSE